MPAVKRDTTVDETGKCMEDKVDRETGIDAAGSAVKLNVPSSAMVRFVA